MFISRQRLLSAVLQRLTIEGVFRRSCGVHAYASPELCLRAYAWGLLKPQFGMVRLPSQPTWSDSTRLRTRQV